MSSCYLFQKEKKSANGNSKFHTERLWVRSWAWLYWSVNTVLERLWQEDCCEFQASLGHRMRPVLKMSKAEHLVRTFSFHHRLILNKDFSNILIFSILLFWEKKLNSESLVKMLIYVKIFLIKNTNLTKENNFQFVPSCFEFSSEKNAKDLEFLKWFFINNIFKDL